MILDPELRVNFVAHAPAGAVDWSDCRANVPIETALRLRAQRIEERFFVESLIRSHDGTAISDDEADLMFASLPASTRKG